MERLYEIIEDRHGRLSSKRVMGMIGGFVSLGMGAAKLIVSAPQASETLILGILTASFALLGAGMLEKRTTEDERR